jgi:hypothetical protein
MSTLFEDHRPCERQCLPESEGGCGRYKHHSRFRHWKDCRNSTVSTPLIRFSLICRDCEQRKRNERKNADRPLAIIKDRASAAATKAGVSFEFFWIEMNYRSLVAPMRAMMTPEALCQGCGHKFVNERDIQIEHCEPPRHPQDWTLLHTRNLRFLCGSCNNTKKRKPFMQWLEEQELCRLSHKTSAVVKRVWVQTKLLFGIDAE